GQEMPKASLSYISQNPRSDLYYRYFKNNNPNAVASMFNAVATGSSSWRTIDIDCSDPYGNCQSRGWVAYTLDPPVRNVPQSDLCTGATSVDKRNVRGAIMLHELTHALNGTVDINRHGCPVDEQLDANVQLRNADNYNCFAASVWKNTRCGVYDRS
ncbi:hypothetical protein MPER_00327, partial [Moniliophthora perniciosa FA553]